MVWPFAKIWRDSIRGFSFGHSGPGGFRVWLGRMASSTGIAAVMMGCAPSPDIVGFTYISGEADSENRLLTISVEGPILGSPPDQGGSPFVFSSLGGVTYGYEVQQALEEMIEEESVKGILLRFATPGGTIFGSRAIYDGIEAYQEATQRPVIIHIEGASASGGVMAMVGADAIYADYGSVIGSIGVIGAVFNYYDQPTAFDGGLLGGGVTTENGIEQFVITAGRSKDFGNPFRQPTDEELNVAQQTVDHEYTRFVDHVAQARGLDPTTIREDMGALLFDNQTAEQYQLIDGTLNRPDAIKDLAGRAGVGEDYQLVRIQAEPPSLLGTLLGQAPTSPPVTYDYIQRQVSSDRCQASQQAVLAYHGDRRQLCDSLNSPLGR